MHVLVYQMCLDCFPNPPYTSAVSSPSFQGKVRRFELPRLFVSSELLSRLCAPQGDITVTNLNPIAQSK
jgi:hypothetical protein